jgi:hypothetical protein
MGWACVNGIAATTFNPLKVLPADFLQEQDLLCFAMYVQY